MKTLIDHAEVTLDLPMAEVTDLESGPVVDAGAITPDAVTIITGTSGNDLLIGDANDNVMFGFGGNDTLLGFAGDDTLHGGQGADVLNGGDGFDTVSYSDALSAVTVDLLNPSQNSGDAAGDTFASIETFQLSNFDDIFTGSGANDNVFGGSGDDRIGGGS